MFAKSISMKFDLEMPREARRFEWKQRERQKKTAYAISARVNVRSHFCLSHNSKSSVFVCSVHINGSNATDIFFSFWFENEYLSYLLSEEAF